MVKFLAWAVCVYLLLKLAHLVVRPATGYGGGAPALTDLLPAGEPNLLLFSLTFAALVTLYQLVVSSAGLARICACEGLLRAARNRASPVPR